MNAVPDPLDTLTWQPLGIRPPVSTRVEDSRFLDGSGRYLDDLVLPGQVFAGRQGQFGGVGMTTGGGNGGRQVPGRGHLGGQLGAGGSVRIRGAGGHVGEVKVTTPAPTSTEVGDGRLL